jgi:hypothetical protein
MLKPQTEIDPKVGFVKPVKARMVVVLPAPFGPKKPKISPLSMLRFRFSTAQTSLYCLVRLRVSIAFSSAQ